MNKFIKKMVLMMMIVTFCNCMNWNVCASELHAGDVPQSQKGTVAIRYKYGDLLFSDVEFRAYRVTGLGEYGQHVVRDQFKPNNINTDQLHDGEYWSSLRQQLDTFIRDEKIKPDYIKKTNGEGICTLDNLELGIYLIQTDMLKKDNKEFYSEPILIAVGHVDAETGEWAYSYELKPKVAVKDIEKPEDPKEDPKDEPEEPKDEPDEDTEDSQEDSDDSDDSQEESQEEVSGQQLPQTGTWAYLIPIFSGIGLILLLVGILLQSKRKCGEEE